MRDHFLLWQITDDSTMRSFDKSQPTRGKNIVLRAATPDDAQFVLSLRSNVDKTRHLNPIAADIEAQRCWLAASYADPQQIYFVICSQTAEPLGLVRIYDPRGDSFCWGSWLIRDGAPSSTAIESALMVYKYALAHGFTSSHFDVRIGNKKVINFHQVFGAVEIRRDTRDVFFEVRLEAINAAFIRYRKYLPS
jgi:hypothetical protein